MNTSGTIDSATLLEYPNIYSDLNADTGIVGTGTAIEFSYNKPILYLGNSKKSIIKVDVENGTFESRVLISNPSLADAFLDTPVTSIKSLKDADMVAAMISLGNSFALINFNTFAISWVVNGLGQNFKAVEFLSRYDGA